MRAERPGDMRWARVLGSSAAGVAAVLGGLLGGYWGALAGFAAGALMGLVLVERARRRARRRRDALCREFPERWRELLLQRYDHYNRMDASWRARFEDDVRLFLAETRITGIGVEATGELRLLVAASAVTLSLGWPDYEWNQVSEVLLYPDDFDRDYAFARDRTASDDDESEPNAAGDDEPEPDTPDDDEPEPADDAGRAHSEGTVILSAPSLEESFEIPDDGYHVGIHEFTHMLDVDQTHFDGIPIGLSGARAKEWTQVAEREMEHLRHGRSAFDDYGAHDPVEFLGVAVEAFFEIPQVVRRRHREVYAILSEYFGQDPAAWDDQRGLKE
ncbi:MAG TPA: M90 family metallopeptidase [Vicinamibacteria bacterium]